MIRLTTTFGARDVAPNAGGLSMYLQSGGRRRIDSKNFHLSSYSAATHAPLPSIYSMLQF